MPPRGIETVLKLRPTAGTALPRSMVMTRRRNALSVSGPRSVSTRDPCSRRETSSTAAAGGSSRLLGPVPAEISAASPVEISRAISLGASENSRGRDSAVK